MQEQKITDPLARYAHSIDYATIVQQRKRQLSALHREHWLPLIEMLHSLPAIPPSKIRAVCEGPVVALGPSDILSPEQRREVEKLVHALFPWRKGPFSLFGVEIDAEWRSDRKWARLEPHVEFRNKRVIDIGCSNGYYMFRMLAHEPELVLGVDPDERSFLSFQLFQHFLQDSRLGFELFGVQELKPFHEFFHVALCMGVIYHRKDPLQCLAEVRDVLVPGGEVVIEGLGLPGGGDDVLEVHGRYAKMRNVYHIPTVARLSSWMREVGFREIQLLDFSPVTNAEQRRTILAPYESLEDFLDPHDFTKTVEGYPAPHRVMICAKKALL